MDIKVYVPEEGQYKDYQEYLKKSVHWKEIAKRRKDFDRERCVLCHKENEILQVHHITYARVGNEKITDLITLCKPCHEFVEECKLEAGKMWSDLYANDQIARGDMFHQNPYRQKIAEAVVTFIKDHINDDFIAGGDMNLQSEDKLKKEYFYPNLSDDMYKYREGAGPIASFFKCLRIVTFLNWFNEGISLDDCKNKHKKHWLSYKIDCEKVFRQPIDMKKLIKIKKDAYRGRGYDWDALWNEYMGAYLD